MQGLVSDIQRFCAHDGPGIRTTVFLKGCNLHCLWCRNPENVSPRPQLAIFPSRCVDCRQCIDVCATGAQGVDAGRRFYLRDRCAACGCCADACTAQALALIGRQMSTEEVVEEVLLDRISHRDSPGGVTFSGGEPLAQQAFLLELLSACKSLGMHTAVETNLAWPWEVVQPILHWLDLVVFDIKLMDSAAHKSWTGQDNARILENAQHLSAADKPLIARTPLVAGINDNPDDVARIAAFLRDFPNLLYYELLPFRPPDPGKHDSLGLEDPTSQFASPQPWKMRALAAEARKQGVPVRCPVDLQ